MEVVQKLFSNYCCFNNDGRLNCKTCTFTFQNMIETTITGRNAVICCSTPDAALKFYDEFPLNEKKGVGGHLKCSDKN